MKKIDLHIHTVANDTKDSFFEFDLDTLQNYVNELDLDAIAITNHNLFDQDQFEEIYQRIENVVVFPGIEIDLEGGHLLLIGEYNEVADFKQKCDLLSNEITSGAFLTVEKLQEIYVDLGKYLLIPHYDKKPKISESVISKLGDHCFVGEVQSPKKFYRTRKLSEALTPVLFTDSRMSSDLEIENTIGRQTFIRTNSDTLSLSSVKAALADKSKVFLSNSGKEDFFQVFKNGQELSSGLNIIIGGRSSGKSYLLNTLQDIFSEEEKSIKYIKQFDLVRDDEKIFSKRIEKDKSEIRENYLKEFRAVVSDTTAINRRSTLYKLDKYVNTLLEFASSEKLQDEYSKATLFKETGYFIRDTQRKELEELLRASLVLKDNVSFHEIIDRHIDKEKILELFEELTDKYKSILQEQLKKEWVNELVKAIRKQLEQKTSSPRIEDTSIDFYSIKIEKEKLKRFSSIANSLKNKKTIKEAQVYQKFKIRAVAQAYKGAQGLLNESGKKVSFASAFKQYDLPLNFLEELKRMDGLEKSELYKYFCRVSYQVLNQFDKKVSGGEMAEFNLLRALQDARQYEMLLIDEPESSFDNLFLKQNVNTLIKEISDELPVVVVTHNNTIGMLMRPDYILFTEREIVDGVDVYQVYSGSPGDKTFKTADGINEVESYKILLNSLEAGEDAYSTRKSIYDSYKES